MSVFYLSKEDWAFVVNLQQWNLAADGFLKRYTAATEESPARGPRAKPRLK